MFLVLLTSYVGGSEELQKEYLGRLTSEPLKVSVGGPRRPQLVFV